ncbi:MAG: YpmA family protein [Clostridia bacterium]|jgi:hypothetical protein
MDSKDKLELKSTLKIEANPELYKIVDFLNKNLKDKNLIFGVNKGVNKDENKMIISIYET